MNLAISKLEELYENVKGYRVKITYHTPRGLCALSVHEKDDRLISTRWLEEGDDIERELRNEVNTMEYLLKKYKDAIKMLKDVETGIYY